MIWTSFSACCDAKTWNFAAHCRKASRSPWTSNSVWDHVVCKRAADNLDRIIRDWINWCVEVRYPSCVLSCFGAASKRLRSLWGAFLIDLQSEAGNTKTLGVLRRNMQTKPIQKIPGAFWLYFSKCRLNKSITLGFGGGAVSVSKEVSSASEWRCINLKISQDGWSY